MLCNLEDVGPGDIDAGLNAAKTHDASVKPLVNQGGSIRSGWSLPLFRRKLVALDSKFIRPVLELTFPSRITNRTVQRVVDQ